MRILIVCPDSPYPPHDGGSLRIINLARSLAWPCFGHVVDLCRFADEAARSLSGTGITAFKFTTCSVPPAAIP